MQNQRRGFEGGRAILQVERTIKISNPIFSLPPTFSTMQCASFPLGLDAHAQYRGTFHTFYFSDNLRDSPRISEMLRRIRILHLPFFLKIKSAKRVTVIKAELHLCDMELALHYATLLHSFLVCSKK